MSQAPPICRRWFQFSLVEYVLVPMLLTVVWWESAIWPVREAGIYLREIAANQFVEEPIAVDQPPKSLEIATRGVCGSLVVVGVWLIVRLTHKYRDLSRSIEQKHEALALRTDAVP